MRCLLEFVGPDHRGRVCFIVMASSDTLEAIVACHVSSAKHAAWTELPLKDGDREIEVLTG